MGAAIRAGAVRVQRPDLDSGGGEMMWPADEARRWAVDRLVPSARNARTHTDAQVAQIAASIREWGWTVPVLVDEDGNLIAGHGRVLAARLLGLAEVPVVVARGWSDAKKRAYMLADNKLALNAGWDEALLRLELRSEEHTSELQSRQYLVCRLLLAKKRY